MSRDERERLADILDAVEAIGDYAGGRLEDVSIVEPIALDAILLRLMVIGEAIKNLSPDLRGRVADVPWSDYASLRDLIAHQYFRIQTRLIEDTLRRDLPKLRRVVTELLGDGA